MPRAEPRQVRSFCRRRNSAEGEAAIQGIELPDRFVHPADEVPVEIDIVAVNLFRDPGG